MVTILLASKQSREMTIAFQGVLLLSSEVADFTHLDTEPQMVPMNLDIGFQALALILGQNLQTCLGGVEIANFLQN